MPDERRAAAAGAAAPGPDPAVLELGRRIRAEVTGTDYAARADAGLDPALGMVRDAITELVWGRVWSREGIDRRTRSFMNIAMLTALGRTHELAVNVGMALNNGLGRDDIAEAILHATAYCGVPAGIASLRAAQQAFDDADAAAATASRVPGGGGGA